MHETETAERIREKREVREGGERRRREKIEKGRSEEGE